MLILLLKIKNHGQNDDHGSTSQPRSIKPWLYNNFLIGVSQYNQLIIQLKLSIALRRGQLTVIEEVVDFGSAGRFFPWVMGSPGSLDDFDFGVLGKRCAADFGGYHSFDLAI
jgi:hypothetical protein